MSTQLSDEVWNQLDPAAGRVSSRANGGVTLAVITLTVLAFAGVLIGRSGAIVPHLGVQPGWEGSSEYGETSELLVNRYHSPVTTYVSQQFTITNDSWYELEIVGVDVDRLGMLVERVAVGSTHFDAGKNMWRTGGTTLTGAGPYPLPPGEQLIVTVYYDITDCHVVTSSVQPIPVLVQRWHGQQSVDITLLPLRPYRDGGWSVSGSDDPKAVQWQRFLADYVCQIPYPDGLQ